MFLHKKIPQYGLFLVLACLCFWSVHPDIVFAQGAGASLPSGLEADIANIMSKAISLLNILTWILFIFLNFVLDPQFIFNLDSGGSFMGMLNQIWQLSRDLMNVAFALILVGTAIYTIITANKEFVTSHAKKFILAVILINFSWFVPQVIIDVSNVAAATIYGIPSLLFQNSAAMTCKYKSSIKEYNECALISGAVSTNDAIYSCTCRAVVNVDMFMSRPQRQAYEAKKSDGWTCKGDIICIQTKPWSATTISGHSAILNGLIINHAHLMTMANVPGPTNSDDIGDMIQFVLVEGIILLIHVAMFFPLLAMFIAFLIRIPILWLTMAFMPFYFLGFVIGDYEYAGMTKQIWEQFLKAAFLPAAVAVPLSVGFILVNTADQLGASPIESVKIRLIDGISNYWELLWWLMTLGVLWVGTFTVLEKAGGLYSKVAGTIKNYGEAWGKVALKAPLSVPLPGMSMSPLATLKAFHPRNIDASISGNEGIRGFTRQFADGTLGLNDGKVAELARLGDAERKQQLDQMHQDLLDLKTAMQTEKQGGAGAAAATAEKNRLLDKIKSQHDVDLKGNTADKLDNFVKKLTSHGVSTQGSPGKDLKDVSHDISQI